MKHGRLNTGGPQPEPISEDASSFLKDLNTAKERHDAFEKKYGHELTIATMNYGYWQRYRDKGVYIDLSDKGDGKLNPEELRQSYASAFLKAFRSQPEDKQDGWYDEFLSDQDSLTEIEPFIEPSI